MYKYEVESQAMKWGFLQMKLAECEEHLARLDRLIELQRALILNREEEGVDASSDRAMLKLFERVQAERIDRRNFLLGELAARKEALTGL